MRKRGPGPISHRAGVSIAFYGGELGFGGLGSLMMRGMREEEGGWKVEGVMMQIIEIQFRFC